MVEQRPDLLEGVEYVLTEGGGARPFGSRTVHFVETTQKTPLWLRLRATGKAGHGSTAIRDSAANHLVRALERIRTYRAELKLVPPVVESIRAAADLVADPDRASSLRNIEASIADPLFLQTSESQYGICVRPRHRTVEGDRRGGQAARPRGQGGALGIVGVYRQSPFLRARNRRLRLVPHRDGPGDGPAHGVDERISVAAIHDAPRVLFDVLMFLAGPNVSGTR